MNSPARYGALPQALHWLTAIFVIAGWLLGQFIDAFPKGPPRTFALLTHMTLGEFVILFLIARLIWRFANPPPPVEPTQFGRLLEVASQVSHWTLYALLVAVPVVGIVVELKRGQPLPVSEFGMSRRRGRPIGRRRGTRSGRTKFSPTRFSSLPVSMPPRRWCIITRFGIAPWCECCRAVLTFSDKSRCSRANAIVDQRQRPAQSEFRAAAAGRFERQRQCRLSHRAEVSASA